MESKKELIFYLHGGMEPHGFTPVVPENPPSPFGLGEVRLRRTPLRDISPKQKTIWRISANQNGGSAILLGGHPWLYSQGLLRRRIKTGHGQLPTLAPHLRSGGFGERAISSE